MKKFLIIFLVIIILSVTGFIFLILQVSSAPYIVPTNKMSYEELSSLQQVGEYKNVLKDGDKNFVIFSKDTSNTEAGILVRIFTNPRFNEELSQVYEQKECGSSSKTSGTMDGISYLNGRCDSGAYYTYSEIDEEGDLQGILFETNTDGQDSLREFIESYIE